MSNYNSNSLTTNNNNNENSNYNSLTTNNNDNENSNYNSVTTNNNDSFIDEIFDDNFNSFMDELSDNNSISDDNNNFYNNYLNNETNIYLPPIRNNDEEYKQMIENDFKININENMFVSINDNENEFEKILNTINIDSIHIHKMSQNNNLNLFEKTNQNFNIKNFIIKNVDYCEVKTKAQIIFDDNYKLNITFKKDYLKNNIYHYQFDLFPTLNKKSFFKFNNIKIERFHNYSIDIKNIYNNYGNCYFIVDQNDKDMNMSYTSLSNQFVSKIKCGTCLGYFECINPNCNGNIHSIATTKKGQNIQKNTLSKCKKCHQIFDKHSCNFKEFKFEVTLNNKEYYIKALYNKHEDGCISLGSYKLPHFAKKIISVQVPPFAKRSGGTLHDTTLKDMHGTYTPVDLYKGFSNCKVLSNFVYREKIKKQKEMGFETKIQSFDFFKNNNTMGDKFKQKIVYNDWIYKNDKNKTDHFILIYDENVFKIFVEELCQKNIIKFNRHLLKHINEAILDDIYLQQQYLPLTIIGDASYSFITGKSCYMDLMVYLDSIDEYMIFLSEICTSESTESYLVLWIHYFKYLLDYGFTLYYILLSTVIIFDLDSSTRKAFNFVVGIIQKKKLNIWFKYKIVHYYNSLTQNEKNDYINTGIQYFHDNQLINTIWNEIIHSKKVIYRVAFKWIEKPLRKQFILDGMELIEEIDFEIGFKKMEEFFKKYYINKEGKINEKLLLFINEKYCRKIFSWCKTNQKEEISKICCFNTSNCSEGHHNIYLIKGGYGNSPLTCVDFIINDFNNTYVRIIIKKESRKNIINTKRNAQMYHKYHKKANVEEGGVYNARIYRLKGQQNVITIKLLSNKNAKIHFIKGVTKYNKNINMILPLWSTKNEFNNTQKMVLNILMSKIIQIHTDTIKSYFKLNDYKCIQNDYQKCIKQLVYNFYDTIKRDYKEEAKSIVKWGKKKTVNDIGYETYFFNMKKKFDIIIDLNLFDQYKDVCFFKLQQNIELIECILNDMEKKKFKHIYIIKYHDEIYSFKIVDFIDNNFNIIFFNDYINLDNIKKKHSFNVQCLNNILTDLIVLYHGFDSQLHNQVNLIYQLVPLWECFHMETDYFKDFVKMFKLKTLQEIYQMIINIILKIIHNLHDTIFLSYIYKIQSIYQSWFLYYNKNIFLFTKKNKYYKNYLSYQKIILNIYNDIIETQKKYAIDIGSKIFKINIDNNNQNTINNMCDNEMYQLYI